MPNLGPHPWTRYAGDRVQRGTRSPASKVGNLDTPLPWIADSIDWDVSKEVSIHSEKAWLGASSGQSANVSNPLVLVTLWCLAMIFPELTACRYSTLFRPLEYLFFFFALLRGCWQGSRGPTSCPPRRCRWHISLVSAKMWKLTPLERKAHIVSP